MACSALSQLLPRPRQAPLAWLVDFNRTSLRRACVGGALVFSLQVGLLLARGEVAGALSIAVMVATCAVATALLAMPPRSATLEMVLLYFLLLVANVAAAGCAPLDSRIGFRLRASALVHCFFKMAPGIFGLPLSMAAGFVVLSLAVDIGATEWCRLRYGDPGSHFPYVLYSVAGLMFCWQTSGRMWRIFEAQEALVSEMALMEQMLAMMCDGSLWLAEDGNTVVREDPRFRMIAGRIMVGRRFFDAFDPQESDRLQVAVLQARMSPALLPTTLQTAAGAQVPIELFIVGNRGRRSDAEALAEKAPSFLIGVRTAAPDLPTAAEAEGAPARETAVSTSSMDGAQADALGEVVPEADGDSLSAAEDARDVRVQIPRPPEDEQPGDQPGSEALEPSMTLDIDRASRDGSEVMTTVTGRIFNGVRFDRPLAGAQRDQLQELRKGLESVMLLGRRERWIVSARDLEVHTDRVLGTGGFGSVLCGSLYGTPVAVKSVRYSEPSGTASRLEALTNEVRILRHIRHPNVVSFNAACMDSELGVVLLVLELVEGPTFNRYVAAHSEDAKAHGRHLLLLDIACALRYLHAQEPQIVHGDVKGSNVLVEQKIPRAKLTDFGLARVLSRSAAPLGGTLTWMAPEVIRSPTCKPRSSADVFSFGRVAYLAVACREPLKGVPKRIIEATARSGSVHPLRWREDGPMHRECRDMCARALSFDPEQRPAMAQVHAEVAAWRVAPASDAASQGRRFALLPFWRRASGAGRAAPKSAPGAVVTPAGAGGEPLPADPVRLVLPARRSTRQAVKKAFLLEAVQRWNFRQHQGACCQYHMAISELQHVCQALTEHECQADFQPAGTWQCQACGVLDASSQRVCPVCSVEQVPSMPSIREADGERRTRSRALPAAEEEGGTPPSVRCSL